MLPEFSIPLALAIFTAVGIGITLFMGVLSWIVRPHLDRPRGRRTYECGYEAKGSARSLGFEFIQYAALFLIFDLAALFLFLYAATPGLPIDTAPVFLLGIGVLGLMILYGTKRRKYYAA